jgi:hypothetical protein
VAWVDDQNLITETSDINNQATIPLTVGPAPSGGGGGGAQYFVSTSSWNTPVGPGRTYTDSAALHAGGWFNTGDYGVPVIQAQPTDPLITITINGGPSWGWPNTSYTIHCPTTGTGATGTDGTLCVIDGTEVYDFWQFHRTAPGANTGTCSAAAHTNIVTGTGWALNGTFPAAGIHAAGSSCLAGLIMNHELTTGINHAVALACRGDITWEWPHFTGEAISCDGNSSTGPIMEGMRLAIPPGTSMPSGLNLQEQTLWNVCKTYGAFVIDVAGGSQSIYFWGDPLTIPQADYDALINPMTFATPGMNAIADALRIVS